VLYLLTLVLETRNKPYTTTLENIKPHNKSHRQIELYGLFLYICTYKIIDYGHETDFKA